MFTHLNQEERKHSKGQWLYNEEYHVRAELKTPSTKLMETS